ncbi:hypothetical protein AMJ80_03655 [bacterium SM23_31]|nr:MAG: hypothetical protein AMJ80_03655 [bacterium SM23_31]
MCLLNIQPETDPTAVEIYAAVFCYFFVPPQNAVGSLEAYINTECVHHTFVFIKNNRDYKLLTFEF